MRHTSNSQAASWIVERLHPFSSDVGGIIPEGFEAYARIFHPPRRRSSDGTLVPVLWRDIAAANNRSIAAEMQRLGKDGEPTRYALSGELLWDQDPGVGCIPIDITVRLVNTLRLHTRTPLSCWFAVWEGWGDLRVRDEGGARFAIQRWRNYVLLHGPIEDALETLSEFDRSYLSPNIWWPDDRAWCVATEVDYSWTYVAGPTSCIEQLLRDSFLEAVSTSPTDGNQMEK